MTKTSLEFTEKELAMAQFFLDREGEGLLENIRTIDFREAGILDSLDMVTLSVYVEKKFEKKLNLSDPWIVKSMSKFDSLMHLVD